MHRLLLVIPIIIFSSKMDAHDLDYFIGKWQITKTTPKETTDFKDDNHAIAYVLTEMVYKIMEVDIIKSKKSLNITFKLPEIDELKMKLDYVNRVDKDFYFTFEPSSSTEYKQKLKITKTSEKTFTHEWTDKQGIKREIQFTKMPPED